MNNKHLGNSLELTIEHLFKQYRKKGIVCQKLHDAPNHREKLPFDYFMFHEGKLYAFDAKFCSSKSINIKSNLKAHQIEALHNIHNHGGEAFFLIYFAQRRKLCKLDTPTLLKMISEGKKSIHYSELTACSLNILNLQ